MKKLPALLAAVALVGCSNATDPAQKVRDAMPQAASVQLQPPSVDGAAPPTALVADTTLATAATTTTPTPPYPTQSEFATISYWAAVGINGGTWWTLNLVRWITDHHATYCDDQSCTWGPWRGDDGLNDWKLTATKSGSAYDWVLAAQNAVTPAGWVALLSGHALPGRDRDHGSGNFLIDFGAQDALAHGPGWVKKDHGTVEITYDNTAGTFVTAAALGGVSSDPATPGDRIDANYSFAKTGPGGQIQIAIHNTGTVAVPKNEAVKLNTRWLGGGAGRGDALWSSDGGATWLPNPSPPFITECWDGAAASWAETYDSRTPSGDPALCVFATGQAPTVALP